MIENEKNYEKYFVCFTRLHLKINSSFGKNGNIKSIFFWHKSQFQSNCQLKSAVNYVFQIEGLSAKYRFRL